MSLNTTGFAPHFDYEQLCHSNTADEHKIDNHPTDQATIDNLRNLSFELEWLKQNLFNMRPILVSSGYRSEAVNKLVGGVPNSAHRLGCAADITVPSFGSPLQVCKMIELHIPEKCVQLIHEFGRWAHFAIAPSTIARPSDKIITIDNQGTRVGLLPIRS